MRSITPVLIDYWHRLPSSPVHQRRHIAQHMPLMHFVLDRLERHDAGVDQA